MKESDFPQFDDVRVREVMAAAANLLESLRRYANRECDNNPDGTYGWGIKAHALKTALIAAQRTEPKAATEVPPEARAMKFSIENSESSGLCRSCGHSIVWIKTKTGKLMPVNLGGEHEGESHFAHCPQANKWRKKR